MRKSILFFLSLLFLSAGCCTQKSEKPLRIMTFNIRYNNPNDGENAWPNRKDMVASVIHFHHADLVGVQEALKGQMLDLEDRLPEFAWFGVGRDDGKEAGEYSAIFYNKQRFELLEQNTFWLSETPQILGSIGWDAACVRIVTWGHFRDKKTGAKFYHFNTHFDHRGPAARENSANLIVKKIKEIAGDSPVMLTGDFNFPPTSPLYSIITAIQPDDNRVILYDALKASKQPPHGPDWSSHGWRPKGKPGQKIDYIFVTKDVNVLQHGVLSDEWNGRYPSDHLPVLAEITIN